MSDTEKKLLYPSRLKELIPAHLKKTGVTVDQFAKSLGYSGRDALYKVMRGETKVQYDKLKQIADTIGIYPSEILPLEWQKPTRGVNKQLLEEALKKTIYASKMDTGKQTIEQTAAIAAIVYEALQTESTATEVVNLKENQKG